MRQQKVSLNELRREVDSVDDAIHDLLMRRAELAEAVGRHPDRATGEGGIPLSRPARKAEILRRIIGRHRGNLPLRSLVRVWCEILAAGPSERGTVHVYAGEQTVLYRDLARTYFGSLMPMVSHGSATAVLQSCSDQPQAIGIVPLADGGEEGAGWWTHLAPAGHSGPRVVARLPFVDNDGGERPFPQAFAVGAIEQEPTGDDTTLLLIETEGEVSRTRLQTLLHQTGLDAQILAAAGVPGHGTSHLLVANKGFVGAGDGRLEAFVAKAGETILRLAPVGGYANPLDGAAEKSR